MFGLDNGVEDKDQDIDREAAIPFSCTVQRRADERGLCLECSTLIHVSLLSIAKTNKRKTTTTTTTTTTTKTRQNVLPFVFPVTISGQN